MKVLVLVLAIIFYLIGSILAFKLWFNGMRKEKEITIAGFIGIMIVSLCSWIGFIAPYLAKLQDICENKVLFKKN